MEKSELYKISLNDRLTQDSAELKYNLQYVYSNFLFSLNERVIYECSGKLITQNDDIELFNDRDLYIKLLEETVDKDYPAAANLISNQKCIIHSFFSEVLSRFQSDKSFLLNRGIISSKNVKLSSIKLGIGDFHNGQSTTILETSDKSRLVYKPTCGDISKAYHRFQTWVTDSLNIENWNYCIFNRIKYHWQEFVDYEAIESEEELSEYYYKTGVILCITYLLNSTDFHYENLIVNNKSPVLVDHETIIQPRLNYNLMEIFKSAKINIKEDSVLNSLLLPNKSDKTGVPVGMCGLGYSKEKHVEGLKKIGVNTFGNNWKMVTRIVKQNFFESNIPKYKGNKIYLDNYLDETLKGFDSCYNLFLNSRKFLISNSESPLREFSNKSVRFIWRPTNVYVKILEYMRLPKNLTSKHAYIEKIKEYLSIAFKSVPKYSNLNLILDDEVHQMLDGNVPYFTINTSSRDLKTKFGVIKNIFDFNCIDNLERKLNKFSSEDLESQKRLIIDSIK